MNQPKFKLGDRVTNGMVHFTVNMISTNGTYGFLYGSKSTPTSESDCYLMAENALELYQEPRGNKLYAYESSDSMVCFYPKELIWLDSKRVPEFDIDLTRFQPTARNKNES